MAFESSESDDCAIPRPRYVRKLSGITFDGTYRSFMGETFLVHPLPHAVDVPLVDGIANADVLGVASLPSKLPPTLAVSLFCSDSNVFVRPRNENQSIRVLFFFFQEQTKTVRLLRWKYLPADGSDFFID